MSNRITVAIVTLLLTACQTVTPRTWQLPPDVKTLQIYGYEIAYLERGAGPPVVLVHGTLSDYRSWSAQTEALSAQHHVIAMSLRHYYPERWDGKSDDFTLSQHAVDLAEFIRQLNFGKAHVVGHSRGATVALLMATRHPELVKSLVLAEPQPIDALIPSTPQAAQAAERRQSAIRGALDQFDKAQLDTGLGQFINFVGGAGAWQAAPDPQKQVWRDNAWSIKSLLADSAESITCKEMSRVDLPVLLVAGEKSPPIYRVMLEAVQKCLPRRDWIAIPNAGHAMHRMNSSAFNQVVLTFISKQ